jgi:hypothetical protein
MTRQPPAIGMSDSGDVLLRPTRRAHSPPAMVLLDATETLVRRAEATLPRDCDCDSAAASMDAPPGDMDVVQSDSSSVGTLKWSSTSSSHSVSSRMRLEAERCKLTEAPLYDLLQEYLQPCASLRQDSWMTPTLRQEVSLHRRLLRHAESVGKCFHVNSTQIEMSFFVDGGKRRIKLPVLNYVYAMQHPEWHVLDGVENYPTCGVRHGRVCLNHSHMFVAAMRLDSRPLTANDSSITRHGALADADVQRALHSSSHSLQQLAYVFQQSTEAQISQLLLREYHQGGDPRALLQRLMQAARLSDEQHAYGRACGC